MLTLPDYPWNAMAPYVERAAAHPQGVVNLSIGTPVDPTPELLRNALAAATDAPGYPTTHGTVELRRAISAWYERRRATPGLDPEDIMPTVGSKELVAWLPLLLGIGAGDLVVRPTVAYPTYDIGARLAGAESVAADSLGELSEEQLSRVKLVWVNSPGNPTGIVRSTQELRGLVDAARALGAVVASDECYAELGWGQWEDGVPGVLEPAVSGGDLTNLLAVYSMSKQSNLAGYRAAFVAGAPNLMPALINNRKHAGMIVPAPVQEAMRIGLGDDSHVQTQKDLYRERRARLIPALEGFGLRIDHSEAGLYLWCTAGEDTWLTIGRLADLGIVAGPGTLYGTAGDGFVRIALTATDERIDSAVERLNAAH
ncbi:succinyldiaminopimelate transaminase [Paeniglutamicibacter cryotolerans]|uniref:Succinyldiaminopimelate transaminase n=1 Tax=Paeniglutamicibacter cryotolerans TaxID=670079 RepID=A0A839QD25_9MICC|nr:succinyldiaminopimelate transaminase [Paeniglutamicibacter cryotolerans]MBB2993810.1 succinyldiaminopimelate transaminase [Paeniglutamicibacter cryotolerans]MBB2996502.1 succinyldiaminopimelate transaminase [Paeniglutamicibacter cryotolerans]